MLPRKFSEFSLSGANNTYSEDKDVVDLLANVNNTKKKLPKEEMIKAYIRIRQIENNPGLFRISSEDEKTLRVHSDELAQQKNTTLPSCTSFNFSKIFDTNSRQIDLFETTCFPLIDDLIKNKKSGLIFSYGLTNSGKTHTIIGNPTDPGILPLTLKGIYEQIETEIINKNFGFSPEIFSNYIEIYNEEVFDLLANDGKGQKGKKKVNVKEKDKIFYVKDVTNKPIRNIEDFNDALNLGLVKKTHAATSLNLHSSRSHTIFKLIIRWPVKIDDFQENEAEYEESTLSIVDLAGSERAYRAETSGKELQQACKINHSLHVLGKCMEIMKHNSVYVSKKFVPFRESKLTMLFQEYFQGDQNIIMITNINPCRDDFEETLRVLSYACIAKEIRPIKSKIITTNAIRKKETYDSCNSEDEEAKTQNRFISKNDNSNQSSSMLFGRESRNQAYQDYPLPHNNINYPPNYNSTLTDQIESLKYEFMNMSKKHEEQLAKYEDLSLTNEFLMSKYKELKFQFKLRELDIRTNLIETISNQIINKKVEFFLNEMEGPRVIPDIWPNMIISNPFYDRQVSEALSKSKDNSTLDNLKKLIKSEKRKPEAVDSEKSKYSDCKDVYQEQRDTNAKINNFNKFNKQKRDQSLKEVKVVSNFQAETSEKTSLKPNNKKKPQSDVLIKEKDISDIGEKNQDKSKRASKNSEMYISKSVVENNQNMVNLRINKFVRLSKENEEKPAKTTDIIVVEKNIFKKSLKQKEKTYKKEEPLKNFSDLDGIRDEETQSNESGSSQIKTKTKKTKKPTKAKKNYKKSSKLNLDTDSELDYSRDSTHNLPKAKKNQKSTGYDEDIEEEKSEDLDKVNKSFKEVKKTKKKTTKKSKKPKKFK